MKSDLQLKKEVMSRLELESKIDSTALGVTVEDGVVTLRGVMENNEDRASAERAVRFVKGVKGLVDDDLRVQEGQHSRPGDSALQTSAGEAIQWLTTVPKENIKISVLNGWVTLEGEVESRHQARSIEEVVTEIDGVRGVKNALTVAEERQLA